MAPTTLPRYTYKLQLIRGFATEYLEVSVLRKILVVIALLGVIPGPVYSADQVASESIRLTLPPTGYAVVGAEMNIYFDNIVLSENSNELKFVVTSDLGKTESNRWTVIPTEALVGDHKWEVEVFRGEKSLGKQSMKWHVSPAKLSAPRNVSILIVGDSLTHATHYPNEVAKRLDQSGLSGWKMLGTHKPQNAATGVAHEGYGGWTWARFLTHYEPMPDPANRKRSSPFVFLDGDKPKLDVARYIQESCQGQQPDFIIVKLGINDCFGANPSTIEETDITIDRMFQSAESLLKAFREAAPKAKIGLCITTPGNTREEAFTANYKGKYPRWGWKQIQHRLVERQIAKFNTEEAAQQGIELIPTELNLDPVDGYPVNNAVHPNVAGYQQIGATIHAWLLAQLEQSAK